MSDPGVSGCEVTWAERVSARVDDALDAAEAGALTRHLAGCAACRALDERLRAVRRVVREARPLADLPPGVLEGQLAALATRLGAEAPALQLVPVSEAPTLSLVPASEKPTLRLVEPVGEASARGARRVVEEPAANDPPAQAAWLDAARRWAPLGWKLSQAAVVGAFLVVGVTLLRARLSEFQADLAHRAPPTDPPKMVDPAIPTAPPEEGPPPPVFVPDAPPAPETPTTPTTPGIDPDVPPIAPPPEAPRPTPPDPLVPEVAPVDTGQPREGPGRTGQEPPVVVVQLDLDALGRLIAQIRDRATPADQRPGMVEALGDRRFDHERAYAALASILAGELDTVALAPECRAAAIEACARLGTEGAAIVLARAPARPASRDADEGALLAAMLRAQDDGAVARLAEEVASAEDDRRFLLLRALEQLGRPAATPGLLALLPLPGAPRPPRLGGPLLRVAAAALGASGDPRAEGPLVAALEGDGPGRDDSRLTMLRQGAALGLGGVIAVAAPDEGALAVAALTRAAADRDEDVARAAVRGLGRSARPEVLNALVLRVDPAVERRALVRGLAQEGLLRLTGQRFATAAAWRTWLAGSPALPRPGAPLPLAGQPGADVADAGFFRLPALAARVVFVVDMSGSMEGGKWQLVTFELRRALERLGPQTAFDVVLFSDATKAVFGELVPGTRPSVERALRFVGEQRLVSSATTAIAPALRRALGPSYPRVDTIYFVSDGSDTRQDEVALRHAIARENLARPDPVRIHAVLVRQGGAGLVLDPGPDDPRHPWDIRFMRGLARDSGGVLVRN